MKKSIKIIFTLMILIILLLIILLLIILLVKKDYNKYNYIISKLDNLLYEYKIDPIIQELNKLNVIIDFRINDIYGQNKEININNFKEKLNNAGINYISNLSDKNTFTIKYIENITPNSIECIYIFSNNKFNNYNLGINYKDLNLYKMYGGKFTTGILVKINNNYAKYCIYKLF